MSKLLFANYIYGTFFRYQPIPHLLLDVDIKIHLPLFSDVHKNKLHFLTDATNYQTCEELANIISRNDCNIIPKKRTQFAKTYQSALSRNRSNKGMPNDMFYDDEITTKRRVRRGRDCMVI